MAKMTQFMKPEIVEGKWVEVECSNGTWWLPGQLPDSQRKGELWGAGIPVWWNGSFVTIGVDEGRALRALAFFYEIYLPGHSPISFEVKHGLGARLSAPGHLDSTDWRFFGTYNMAKTYLEDLLDGKENADDPHWCKEPPEDCHGCHDCNKYRRNINEST